MIEELRLEVLDHLRYLFPTNLLAFSKNVVSHTPDEIIRVITMALRYQIVEILPAAYLLCFDLSVKHILDGVTTTKNGQSKTRRLPPAELRRYLVAKEEIFSLGQHVFSFLATEMSECENESCRRALLCIIQHLILYNWIRNSAAISSDQYLDPEWLIFGKETMCLECKEWWKTCLQREREHVWQKLPSALSLPDWGELRAAATARRTPMNVRPYQ